MRLTFETGRRREQRSAAENPNIPLTDTALLKELFGIWNSAAGPTVTVKTAMGVPAFWCSVNVLADLIASLPVHEYRKTDAGRERVNDGMVAGMMAGTVNDDFLTSFKWRRQAMVSALTTGAGRTYVEKDGRGRVVNLWPMETKATTVRRSGGRTLYDYRQGGRVTTYSASEVIDIDFLGGLDGVSVFNPVKELKDTIGLAIALERYASKFFQNGGVPPLALQAPAGSPAAISRGKEDTRRAIEAANAAGDPVLFMPDGTRLEPIGFEPDKGQLVEAQRFVVEQHARIFNLPPSFIHDLTHGSFQNTEQGDLHLVKHTAMKWVRLWETEMNAKIYGARASARYVEFVLDAILRGDFKTRMEGWARGIQSGQVTPNEARRAENREDQPGGDRLYIQGATVPIEMAGQVQPAPPPVDPSQES